MAAARKTFDARLLELETIIRKMEEGQLSLEEMLKLYEQGMKLHQSLSQELDTAEKRMLELTGDSYNVLATVKDSWTPERGGITLPLASNARPFGYIDSRYVQSASYLKLRNLTIGYRLKIEALKNLRIEGIRVYATASNLLTITPYKGYDPEVASGTDSGAYPSSRSFVFGVHTVISFYLLINTLFRFRDI